MKPVVAFGLLGLLMLGGCVTPEAQRNPNAAGQELKQALAQLQAQADKVVPLQASTVCRLGYPDKNGELKESTAFRATLYMDPPHNIYMQSFVGLGSSGKVEMGSNAEMFWMGIKLDVDEFWWGRWEKAHNYDDMQISPKAVLEALGVLELGDSAFWSMEHQGDRIVLTQRGGQQRVVRQLFVDPVSYLPERIQYYDHLGQQVTLVVELARYTSLANGFKVPQDMAVSTFEGDECVSYIRLNVKQVSKKTFSESTRQATFSFKESKLAGYGKVTEVTK